jgi:integrase
MFGGAVASLGLKGFTFHGLRGVSATLAARQGATTKELMRRLGHTTADMAMRYQRAETDRDRALANAMSEQVARAAHSVPSAETGNGSAV